MAMSKLILISFILLTNAFFHPLKMTTSRLSIDQASGEIDIYTNFFQDDFKAHLLNLYMVDISTLDQSAKDAMQAYIQQNFLIDINKSQPTFELKKIQIIDENVIQVKMSAILPGLESIEKINITNTLLLDAFPKEQENIVHLRVDKQETKILHFSAQESIQSISL